MVLLPTPFYLLEHIYCPVSKSLKSSSLFSPSDGLLICMYKALKPGSENRIRFCLPPESKAEKKNDFKIQENKKQPGDIAGR